LAKEDEIDLDEFDDLEETSPDEAEGSRIKIEKKPIAKKFDSKFIKDENGNLNIDLFLDILSSDIRRRICA